MSKRAEKLKKEGDKIEEEIAQDIEQAEEAKGEVVATVGKAMPRTEWGKELLAVFDEFRADLRMEVGAVAKEAVSKEMAVVIEQMNEERKLFRQFVDTIEGNLGKLDMPLWVQRAFERYSRLSVIVTLLGLSAGISVIFLTFLAYLFKWGVFAA